MIKNKTIYTKEILLGYGKYWYFNYRKFNRTVFSLFGILSIVSGIIYFLSGDFIAFPIGFIVGLFLLVKFNSSFIPKMWLKHILKENPMILNLENTYIFHNDFMELFHLESHEKISYQQLYHYFEYQNYFYIHWIVSGKINHIFIDKNGMIEGSVDDLRKLLQEKIVK